MHPVDLVIRGRRVVTEHGIGPASVHVSRGYISSISIFEDDPTAVIYRSRISVGDHPGLLILTCM